jgi:hydrogenase nickel incorporation protein HypB
MCTSCGCSGDGKARLTDLHSGAMVALEETQEHQHSQATPHTHGGDGHSHPHVHVHDPEKPHTHPHEQESGASHSHRHEKTVLLEQEILVRNNRLAERNRGWLAGRNILALNLMSSPGAGKTTLLERTIRDLAHEFPLHVIEGDQETVRDAERIRATGCRVVQINTGTACHLDAAMVARGLQQLDPPMNSAILIENVGNLVCPALFDLGERAKVVVVSVTEGEDKPIKYPHMFRASTLMLLNKIDLLPHVSFNLEHCQDYARQVNPRLQIAQISATRGDGLPEWYSWLRDQFRQRSAW